MNATGDQRQVTITARTADSEETAYENTVEVPAEDSLELPDEVPDGSYQFAFDVPDKNSQWIEYDARSCRGGKVTATIDDDLLVDVSVSACRASNT